MLKVNLTCDSLVTCSYRRYTLRDLDRVEPHTWCVAEAIRRTCTLHNWAVLVENLSISTCQAEHLNLTCTRDSVAITYSHRCRVLERLSERAAGHLTQTGERYLLVACDTRGLGVVTTLCALNNYRIDINGRRLELDGDSLDVLVVNLHLEGVVTQVVDYQGLKAVYTLESKLTSSRCSSTRSGVLPEERSTDKCLLSGCIDNLT